MTVSFTALKKAVCLNLLFGLTGVCYSQEKTYETLTTKNGNFKPGFTINPSINYSRAGKGDLFSVNLAAGLVLQDKWTIGGFYNTSVNNFRPENLNVANAYADIRYGGLHLEYTMQANKVFHVSFPLQLGYGEIELDRDNGSANFGEDHFFVVKPGIMGELNVHPNIRLQTGINYRVATSFDYQNLSASDISGLGLQLGLRVGLFKRD